MLNLISQEINMKKINVLKKIVILLTFLLIVIATCLLIPSVRNYILPKDFDSIEWIQSYERFKNSDADGSLAYKELEKRKEMVYSLVRTKKLIGKNRVEVNDILGMDENSYGSSEWLYWLSFTASDNKWLRVGFNPDNTVDSVSIFED